jgi:hypothetical protein
MANIKDHILAIAGTITYSYGPEMVGACRQWTEEFIEGLG